jgi:hypothetical protein
MLRVAFYDNNPHERLRTKVSQMPGLRQFVIELRIPEFKG